MSTTFLRTGRKQPLPAFQHTSLPLKTFSLDEYHRLVDNGGIATTYRMELLHGQLVYKIPQNHPHAASSSRLEKRVKRLLDEEWEIRIGKPISVPDRASELEPDISILRGPETRYDERQPTSDDLEWVVEVANTLLSYDREDKLAEYAKAAIPIYWIVNLVERRIEVYSDPTGPVEKPNYRQQSSFATGC